MSGAIKSASPVRRQKPLPAPRAGTPDLLSPFAFWVVAIILVAGVFAAYSPALNFQFILDDNRFLGDPRLQLPGHVGEYFTSWVWAQFTGGPLSFYRPVFLLWLRANFLISEMSPWGWHLLSIAKHVAVAILLGLLVWRLLRDRVAALLAGALFALDPAQTESVAWVTVPDPLMSAAVLGSVLLYLRYAEKSRKATRPNPTGRPSVAWLIGSVVCCLAALLAKETAIVLPAVLFAVALIRPQQPLADGRGSWGRLLRAGRETLPFLGVTAVYFLLRLHALGGWLVATTQNLPWSTVLLSFPATLWFYVKVLFWPVRPRAFADPSQVDTFSVHGVLLPGLAVACAVAVLTWGWSWAWRRARHDGVRCALVLGGLLLVLPLLPALNLNGLNPGDSLHGRYAYLPSAGLMLLLATGWHLLAKWRTLWLSTAGLLSVAFALLTTTQEMAWKDNLTVFTVAQQNAPHNGFVARNLARAHVQVGLELGEAGRCGEAVPVFEQATRQIPQDWVGWAALGNCLAQLNELPRAEQALRRASELSHQPRVTEQWQQVRVAMEGK